MRRAQSFARSPEAHPLAPYTFKNRIASFGERIGWGRLFVALMLTELCGLYILEWPLYYSFNSFAFWDGGGHLVAYYLLQHGYRPITDFGWQYGLLPLFIQEQWFRLFSAAPASFIALSTPFTLVFAIAFARFVSLESGVAGHSLAVLSLPIVCLFGVDAPHALEPALLSIALLLQAKGRRNWALALITASCFTKPSMGYLYGLALVIVIGVELHRQSKLKISCVIGVLAPALVTGFGLFVALGLRFGDVAVLHSLLPFTGARVYRAMHFGWSGTASGLFYFPGVRPAYYIGSPVTFWLCATLYLVGASVLRPWHKVRNHTALPRNYEIVFTCAVLHVGFIAFFYGPPSSWIYYAYIAAMGAAATDGWSVTSRRITYGLCILAALGNYTSLKSSFIAWRSTQRAAITAGLYADSTEAKEWAIVISIIDGKRAAVFNWAENVELLFPQFDKPAGAFFVPGNATTREIGDELAQLHAARVIVVPLVNNSITHWPGPEFRTVLDGTRLVFKGKYFEVYERDAAASHRFEPLRQPPRIHS